MAVNPGIAGQLFLDFVEPKIEKLVKIRRKFGFNIIIDGGIDKEVCMRLSKIGVEGYVLGNLILFKQKEKDYKVLIKGIRTL